jgi:hypothetical protein
MAYRFQFWYMRAQQVTRNSLWAVVKCTQLLAVRRDLSC